MKTEAKGNISKVLCVAAAFVSTLALNCRWSFEGGSEGGFVLSFLQKFGIAFNGVDFADIIIVLALSFFYLKYLRGSGFDLPALILSVVMSIIYIFCVQFRDYNSLKFLFGSKYSILLFFMGILGYSVLLYSLFVFLKDKLVTTGTVASEKKNFLSRFFFPISWAFLMICYLPWLILNYPGSGMPDTIAQFQNYLGDTPWSMWQPPFSSLLMGWLYSLGKSLVDGSFGFFLYALFHSLVATGVFAYSLNRLKKLGAPLKFCIPAALFYGLVPMWGAYAQWVEKDFLFAAVGTLFTTYVIEVLAVRTFDWKNTVKLLVSGLLCAFLRNNGIYAVVPALFVLIFLVAKEGRKWVAVVLLSVLVFFEGITRVLYPAIGVDKTSISETIGFMLQQTARYVNTYPQEISPEEEAVLTQNFQSMDSFAEYDPQFIDPIKRFYNHSAPKEYFALWFRQLFMHPTVYVESYLNGAFGYLAPVAADAGAWIMTDYSGYLKDRMGVEHKGSKVGPDILIALRNPSERQIFIRYFTYPGLYTWCLIFLLYLLGKKKKKGAWAAFIPALVTLLVCTVSPIACAMRYALLAVAATPVLLGWTLVSLRREGD
ncbi:MAG: hypothetical protein ILP13_09285 [Lachnospiraceae bacterium]|nr:hypothetical protein [Lachnospiraceae bacterium]